MKTFPVGIQKVDSDPAKHLSSAITSSLEINSIGIYTH